MTSRHKATVLILMVALVAAGGVIAFRSGITSDSTAATIPSESSADAGFARDMQVHHAQAVEMSFLIRDRSDDQLIRSMALDIVTTQQQQVGQMYAWLELWGLPQTGVDPAMAWASEGGMAAMDHPAESGSMPGMATADELAQLGDANGRDAERLWLKLMIRHHLAGVDMAETALDLAERPEVRQLATAVVTSQQSEIGIMEQMLEERAR